MIRRNQIAWYSLQLGVLSLSLFPALGAAGILIAAFIAIKQQGRSIWQNPTLRTLAYLLILISIGLIVVSYCAKQPNESWLGLANFLPYFILLPSLPLIINTTQKLRRIAWLFIASSPIIVILGLGQMSDGWSFNTILGWELIAGGMPIGRMSSVFINCNFLGLYLSICFAFCCGLIIDNWQDRDLKTMQQYRGQLLFLTIVSFISTIGIIATSSRNIWAISFAMFLAFSLYLGWHYLVLFVMGIMGTIGWSAYGFGGSRDWLRTIIPMRIWDRLSGTIYAKMPAAYLRSNQWKFTLHLIQERPWLGWGLRNFTPLYRAETDYWLGHPHNLFLMFGAEMGLPLAIIFIISIGWIVARSAIVLWRWHKMQPITKSTASSVDWSIDKAELSIEVDCQERSQQSGILDDSKDKLICHAIFFTYFIAFLVCIVFNLLDVSLYDLRSNITGWLLLISIVSVIYRIGDLNHSRSF